MPATERNPMRVLLGVTGGIAAYKAPELVRRLVERGCEVQVVMTSGAHRFVTPLTFEAVSGRRVRDDLWDPSAEASMGHIELARWADVVVVAPATAHFMAELAAGLAGDLLTTLCLATTAPIVLAPAMNQAMWANAAVQANRVLLESRGVRLLGPAEGDQACGEVGPGRMLEPLEIAAALTEMPGRLRLQSLAGLKVLITAGPTREPIDPVRYITNRSSGRMGYALAAAAREAGAQVVLVSGPVSLPAPAGVRRVDVETAEELYAKVHEEIAGVQIFVGCAAVSDYRPQKTATQKIKRTAAEIDRYARERRAAAEPAVHGRVRCRDAGRRAPRAREAREEAHRHDRRESSRARLRFRSGDERAHGVLARRRGLARRGLETDPRTSADRAHRRALPRGAARDAP